VIVTFAGSGNVCGSLEALDTSSTSVKSLSPALVLADAAQFSTSVCVIFCGPLCIKVSSGGGVTVTGKIELVESPSLKKGGDKKCSAQVTGKSSLLNGLL
jgi:hypothetical protein